MVVIFEDIPYDTAEPTFNIDLCSRSRKKSFYPIGARLPVGINKLIIHRAFHLRKLISNSSGLYVGINTGGINLASVATRSGKLRRSI